MPRTTSGFPEAPRLGGPPGPGLTTRPVPGRWSTLEVLCHLADFEAVFAERMKRIIALGPTPLLVAADEKLFTKELKYHDRDADEELAIIEATRGQMARIIRRLAPEQLQLTGVHTAAGLITLPAVKTYRTGAWLSSRSIAWPSKPSRADFQYATLSA